MKQLIPHITFNGDCEEAINFYKEAFDGEIEFVQKYRDSPMADKVPEDHLDKIMHSTFSADGVKFMAADAVPGYERSAGGCIDLSIDFDSKEREAEVFDKMSSRGEILMTLQDTFWGARFGMIKDRFGITWMFNCPLNED